MKQKLFAIWYLIRSSEYLLMTPDATIGVVPKRGARFELMRDVAEKLIEIQDFEAKRITKRRINPC